MAEWSGVVSALAAVAAVLGLAYQLNVANRDGKLNELRRRRQATIAFYSDTILERTDAMKGVPRDHEREEIEREVEAARTDRQVSDRLRDYLNYWELLSNAVRLDVFDRDTVNRIAGARVKNVAEHYRPYIDERREVLGNDELYEGILWLARELD